VGRFFSSFDEAWAAFLERDEPLEDFFAGFPEEEAYLTVWLTLPGPAVQAEATAVQQGLAGIEGLRPNPTHWLHVSLGPGREDDLDRVRERLRDFGSFNVAYGPATCFHEALVLEVHSDRMTDLARTIDPERDLLLFLPHVSVAYVAGTPEPGPSREKLIQLRDRPPVRERISEVQLCVVLVMRSKLLTPWRVAGVVRLD
jgi:hypothetical protein